LIQKNSHDKRNKYSSIINIINQDLQLESIKDDHSLADKLEQIEKKIENISYIQKLFLFLLKLKISLSTILI